MTEIISKNTLLEVRNLKVHFPVLTGIFRRKNDFIRAVDDVSFKVDRGTTVGLVGESGSGKTTIGRSLVKLAPVTEGSILYENEDITQMSTKSFFPYRK